MLKVVEKPTYKYYKDAIQILQLDIVNSTVFKDSLDKKLALIFLGMALTSIGEALDHKNDS